jgi:hypothetical protein
MPRHGHLGFEIPPAKQCSQIGVIALPLGISNIRIELRGIGGIRSMD